MAGNNHIYYWDTCIFIAWFKNESTRKPGELDAIKIFIERFKRREISLITSVLTLVEITVAKIPAGVDTQLEELMQRSNFTQLSTDIRIAKLARDIRNYYLTKTDQFGGKTVTVPDSLHIASAILYRANEFHTFDEHDNTRYNALGLLPLSGDIAGHNLVICKPPIPVQMNLGLRDE